MIEICRFAQEQLNRRDLPPAEREAVVSQSQPWLKGSEVATGPLESLLRDKTRQTIEIGGKSSQQLEQKLKQAGINISSYARDMMRSTDFTTLKDPQELETVRVQVQDLGLSGTPTTSRIYTRAQELGLELCPAEAGPHMRLAYKDQPMHEWTAIAMKQIADRYGDPNVFRLERFENGLWLDGHWGNPAYKWHPENEVVFSLRKDIPQS